MMIHLPRKKSKRVLKKYNSIIASHVVYAVNAALGCDTGKTELGIVRHNSYHVTFYTCCESSVSRDSVFSATQKIKKATI